MTTQLKRAQFAFSAESPAMIGEPKKPAESERDAATERLLDESRQAIETSQKAIEKSRKLLDRMKRAAGRPKEPPRSN